jgi:7,8-dihydropterin-6-yl-methyl-4-(beta-D-ribofuranosyl)aminobenzene 5'-phosphate synthase
VAPAPDRRVTQGLLPEIRRARRTDDQARGSIAALSNGERLSTEKLAEELAQASNGHGDGEEMDMKYLARRSFLVVASLLVLPAFAGSQDVRRITILYDAFGAPSALTRDWGFAALVEYGGKRVLFDTGNDAGIFERNVKALGVDLARLDAVVLSHRHGDHTSGLTYLLAVNPGVPIHAPQEGAFFRGPIPPAFLARQPGLPPELQYYDGKPPARFLSGTPWGDKGDFQAVKERSEILPGFFVFPTRSEKPGTLEMNEVSLAIKTPQGLAVVVGCSHPGVEKILAEAAKIEPRLYTVTGGFHLVMTPEEEVRRVADVLHDELELERVAPGHCTSELGFAVFLERFGERFDKAGVGAVLALP